MVSKNKSKSTTNPLDAHRRAQRQKELQKNKERRDQARDAALAKRDLGPLEHEEGALQQLRNSKSSLSNAESDRLEQIQGEIRRIREAKDIYVKQHPHERSIIYPLEREREAVAQRRADASNTLSKQIQQRDPRRSIYYDATYNPHGAPPPGMPYAEKTPEQWEKEQQFSLVGGSDDDETGKGGEQVSKKGSGTIVGSEDNEGEDEDDDIIMPTGPPPIAHSEDPSESLSDMDDIVMPVGPPPLRHPSGRNVRANPPLPPGPPPPHSFQHLNGRRGHQFAQHPPFRPPYLQAPRPPPYYQAQQFAPPRPSPQYFGPHMPAPSSQGPPGPPPPRPSAFITAEPQLRDLKREATAFVPTALRKKQALEKAKAAKGGLPNAVNSAPGKYDEVDDAKDGNTEAEKVDLMVSLQKHLAQQPGQAKEDDYEKFLGDVKDLL